MSEEQEKNEEEIKLLNKHDFYFETPLYEEISYSDLENIGSLLNGDVDAYSAKNKTETTYKLNFSWVVKLKEEYVNAYTSDNVKGFGVITLKCRRKDNDILRFFVFNDQINKKIEKIGQSPSIASLQFSGIQKKYDKVLSKEYLDEFKKAITSASHGYGVATFVYLRRIFEGLVLEEFQNHRDSFDINEEDFKKKRMEDKIDLLSDLLPSQLIEMKAIYGILSAGVHELDEQTCLDYYNPLKLSIELILDQKIEENEKSKRDKKAKNQIQAITQKLSKKDNEGDE